MTPNAPDSLDSALVRSGRCDVKILFGYASTEICIKLFVHLYTKKPEGMSLGETSASDTYDIPALAKEFAAAIPTDSKISPAEVQGFLMMHRDDLTVAVAEVAEWAESIIKTKARGANVASFANEIMPDHAESSTQESQPVQADSNDQVSYEWFQRKRSAPSPPAANSDATSNTEKTVGSKPTA